MWLDTVRVARDHGALESLLPEGVKRLRDCPYTVFEAIRTALVFLGWEDVVWKQEEMPPKAIWFDSEKLREWWASVKRNREEEMKGRGGGMDSEADKNAAADALIVN